MSMPRVVKEWLTDYKSLSDNEIHTYAATIRQNEELITGLYYLFEYTTLEEALDPVCHQLFQFYRSSESSLRLFSLDFIPILTWQYLSSLSVSGKKSCGGIEGFLLGVYNLEIVESDGKPKTKTFRIPKYAQPSVYHEPSIIGSVSLTDVALSRLDPSEPQIWQSGPFPQYESLNGQNRQGVLAYLQQCYNADIANVSPQSHQMLCKICSKTACTGFSNLSGISNATGSRSFSQLAETPSGSKNVVGELPPRINLSPALMIEMLSGLYYVTFNTELSLGTKAILDMHHRACYELYADVLLVTNAMWNTLRSVPSDSDDRFRNMTTVTPSSSGHAISKSAITNASFRTKKLPDDIAIIPDDETTSKLTTIDEDSNPLDSSNPKHATKTSKFNLIKAMQNKGDKSKNKDVSRKDSIEMTARPVIYNGENVDSVQVGIVKNNARVIVDNVESQHLAKKHVDHENSLTGDEKPSSSPAGVGKHKSIGEILASGAKDLRGKLGHHRHSSGSSINSENYSTNL